MKNQKVLAHLSLLGAAIVWGLMAPIGKAALEGGINALALTSFRMIGGALCFWVASLFAKREHVDRIDYLKFFGAAMFGIIFNQGAYTFGLSMTSPIDASIIVTIVPILTLILSTLFLKEPISFKKVVGVLISFTGALLLILSNSQGGFGEGSVKGNLLCISAACSFSCYLTLFRKVIVKYSIFTLMKWMFSYAAVIYIAIGFGEIGNAFTAHLPAGVWMEVGYVVFFGTFVSYVFMCYGQQRLRPTLVSMYNYVQPIVSTVVSIAMGLAVFGWLKAAAAVLIFLGVYLVTISRSREQMEQKNLQ